MQRKALENASARSDAKLRNAVKSRKLRGKARDVEISRAAAEAQHHSLVWLAEITGAAIR